MIWQQVLTLMLSALFVGAQIDREKQQSTTPRVYSLNVVSTILSRFATTLVTSKVLNPTNTAQEVVFSIQLPSAAFISNFSMEIDGKIVVGNVKEKEKARQQYDAARAQGQSAGLVTQKRETNQFETTVNVAANSQVTFNLTYQEVLQRVQGVYKHIVNINPGQVVEDMRIEVFISETAEISTIFVPEITARTGEMTNSELLKGKQAPDVDIGKVITKDASEVHVTYKPSAKQQVAFSNNGLAGQLVVLYDVTREQTGGEIKVVNGYFVHFFAPDGLVAGNKRVVFVLDISGSMLGQKIMQMKQAMQVILNDTKEGDKFNIITFSTDVSLWKPQVVPASAANIQEARSFVNDIQAVGSTNIHDAILKGLEVLKNTSGSTQSLADMIVFLTDGLPTVGVTDLDQIVQGIGRKNPESVVSIHSICFGNDADFELLKKISAQNRGVARKVYVDSDAAIQLAGFYNEISSPLLTKLKIAYVNETVLPESLIQNTDYTYYNGSEVMVLGQLNPQAAPSGSDMELSGTVGGNGRSGVSLYQIRHVIPCYQRCPMPLYLNDDVIGGHVHPVLPMPCGCDPPRPWSTLAPLTTPAPLPVASVGGFVERMWAYQTIQNLLKKAKFEETDVAKQKQFKDQALQLSLKYNFVTELTSMVVTQPGKNSTVAENTEVQPRDQDQMKQFPMAASFGQSGGAGAGRLGPVGSSLNGAGVSFVSGGSVLTGIANSWGPNSGWSISSTHGVPPSLGQPVTEELVGEKNDRTTQRCTTMSYRKSSKRDLFNPLKNYHNATLISTEECADLCFYSKICTTALFDIQAKICMLSYQATVPCSEPELATSSTVVLFCFRTRCPTA